MLSLQSADQGKTVVAASAGNHAQGVAFSARHVGVPAKIVMPEPSPIVKIQATESYGAEVILRGNIFDESKKFAEQLAVENDYLFVHPYEDHAVIAGQATIGLEILEQLPDVDSVIVAIGGGGLISGISTTIKALKPSCRVYGVVSEGYPGMKQMYDGQSLSVDFPLGTIADGIAVKAPSSQMYDDYIKEQVDGIASISDDDTARAIVFLLERTKTVAEGSGAISLAAAAMAKKNGWDLGKKCCVVLCGGNIDLNLVSQIIDRGMTASGRTARIDIITNDRPGQLSELTDIIARHGANILQVHHDRTGSNLKIHETAIHFQLETKSFEHVKSIVNEMKSQGFNVL